MNTLTSDVRAPFWCRIGFHSWVWTPPMCKCSKCPKIVWDEETI